MDSSPQHLPLKRGRTPGNEKFISFVVLQGIALAFRTIQKVSFHLALICIVLLLLLSYLGHRTEALLSLNFFFIFWAFDKICAWHFGDKIGIAAQLAIPANAPIALRLVGLLFAVFIMAYGFVGIFDNFATNLLIGKTLAVLTLSTV